MRDIEWKKSFLRCLLKTVERASFKSVGGRFRAQVAAKETRGHSTYVDAEILLRLIHVASACHDIAKDINGYQQLLRIKRRPSFSEDEWEFPLELLCRVGQKTSRI